ncbi:MAG: hypothetical protein HYZ38_18990 [Mycobacterium sp.]|nr:hypothetical protein [Mycobacterium sp.]
MNSTSGAAAATAVLLLSCAPFTVATAWADPEPEPTTTAVASVPPDGQDLHNITYRARIDGVSRGALITYKINDTQVQSADPTMLPGRVFEVQTVLTDPALAGMQVSIQWPYSANLHCEILVDDATVAQADQFIRPRLTPADDDPDYGKLMCGAPLINPAGAGSGSGTVAPADPAAPSAPSQAVSDQPAETPPAG